MGPHHCLDTSDLYKVEMAQYGLLRGAERRCSQVVATWGMFLIRVIGKNVSGYYFHKFADVRYSLREPRGHLALNARKTGS